MTAAAPEAPSPATRDLAHGDGWRVVEVSCRAGPADRPYEERRHWASVAAVLGGTFSYRSSRGHALMTPGSLLLGSAGTCFECSHPHGRGDRCIAFQFAPDVLEDAADALRGVARADFGNPRIPPLESLLPLFAELRSLAHAPDTLRAEQLALDMAATALALEQDATPARQAPNHEARIAHAVRLIDARYAEPLSIAGLARDVGMRRRRFATAFRNVVGTTPYNYTLNRRLAAAAARLREEPTSVLRIALEVGFGDLSEFTRRFRARFGQPPAGYRRDANRQRRDDRARTPRG